MEPQFTPPEFQGAPSVENEPVLSNPENVPNVMPSPESPILSSEREKNTEQLSVNQQVPVIPKPVQQVVTPVSDDAQINDATIISQTPVSARDDDIIEKEWISKVKSIISSTSDNPHEQQSMMSKLMADYVLKRYGREVGKVEE